MRPDRLCFHRVASFFQSCFHSSSSKGFWCILIALFCIPSESLLSISLDTLPSYLSNSSYFSRISYFAPLHQTLYLQLSPPGCPPHQGIKCAEQALIILRGGVFFPLLSQVSHVIPNSVSTQGYIGISSDLLFGMFSKIVNCGCCSVNSEEITQNFCEELLLLWFQVKKKPNNNLEKQVLTHNRLLSFACFPFHLMSFILEDMPTGPSYIRRSILFISFFLTVCYRKVSMSGTSVLLLLGG